MGTAVVEKPPQSAEQIRREIEEIDAELASVKGVVSKKALESEKGKRERRLLSLTKDERKQLEQAISAQAPNGLKVRLMSPAEYEKALQGKVSDPRAEALMVGAEKLGVKLEPGEVITIRKGSGVDKQLSEDLTKRFRSQIEKTLGGNIVVVVSRGSISGGAAGPRGVIPPVGTILRKEYDGGKGKALYEAEVVDEGSGPVIKPLKGFPDPKARFTSLSGAGRAITGYATRGTEWWTLVSSKQGNGRKMEGPAA